MGGDNRYRPGPKFRCPDCYGEQIRADEAQPRNPRTGVHVVCVYCGYEWHSKHKDARKLVVPR